MLIIGLYSETELYHQTSARSESTGYQSWRNRCHGAVRKHTNDNTRLREESTEKAEFDLLEGK